MMQQIQNLKLLREFREETYFEKALEAVNSFIKVRPKSQCTVSLLRDYAPAPQRNDPLKSDLGLIIHLT